MVLQAGGAHAVAWCADCLVLSSETILMRHAYTFALHGFSLPPTMLWLRNFANTFAHMCTHTSYPRVKGSAAQLMLALDYCHKLGVSSRDIKLENTLLEKAPGRRPMLKLCGAPHCGTVSYSLYLLLIPMCTALSWVKCWAVLCACSCVFLSFTSASNRLCVMSRQHLG